MDSILLFIASFFFIGLPLAVFSIGIFRAYGISMSEQAVVLTGGWLGLYLLITSFWRLFIYERMNKLGNDIVESDANRPTIGRYLLKK
ncbi:TPA: hypothetical protein EYP38_00850, partial [Candidatus Micrarchaeota archaeon]|nr:hypothetical protein [Candidatus Micrarchaeota archaeon]